MRIPIESSTSYRGRNSRPNWLAFSAFVALTLITGLIYPLAVAVPWVAWVDTTALVAAPPLSLRAIAVLVQFSATVWLTLLATGA